MNVDEVEMFPVMYDGVPYYKEDCSDVFLCVYHNVQCLRYNNTIYLGDGMVVAPNGHIFED